MLLSNFHFNECTGYTFRYEDRGLRARFNVNLQWSRHKKTLYLGDQLINCIPDYNGGSLPKSNRRKCNFHFHELMYKLYICEDRRLRARFNVNL